MQTWHIVLIIIFVFGIILGNILLLRSTANTKIPTIKKKKSNEQKDEEEGDDW
jgi:F0F1-type ATP synthase assembly protein I